VHCYILLGRTLIMVLHEVQTRIQANWFEKHALIQERSRFKFQYINLHQEKNGSEIHPGFQGLSFRLRIKS
jgi:hypothetical protein